MAQTPTDLTLIAQNIGSQRAALLAYGDDLTLDDLIDVNETTGFSFERHVPEGGGRTLLVQEYHLTDRQLRHVLRRSDQFLGA